MFNFIDNFLSEHAPPWYRTPTVQTAVLGLVFFWVFAAYTTIQFYAASTYGSDLAADSVSAVYLSFTLTCLVSPGIINKLGCRRSMFYGVLGYASLVLSSLIYFLCGGLIWTRRLIVIGGVVLGCAASTLWTAQGRLILQYASIAETLETTTAKQTDGATRMKRKSTTQSGKLMGMFWAIFQCSSIVGGSISFFYFSNKPQGSTILYLLFLGFIIIGALFTQILLPTEVIVMTSTTERIDTGRDMIEAATELTQLTAELTQLTAEPSPIQNGSCDGLSNESWMQESLGTLKLFFTQRMLCLFPLFFYTGFNQPYQQATFGNRFFTRRTIGLELIVFHLMEIIGALVCGRLLDFESSTITRRKRAVACLVVFIIINTAGNILAASQEYAAKENGSAVAHDISDRRIVLPSLAFACWGFADAQIQVFCYWLMGYFFTLGSNHSRSVGCYKCIQSLGTSIGFYSIPTSRFSGISQLICSSVVFAVGTIMAFSQLPSN